jgi:hypothetical protein
LPPWVKAVMLAAVSALSASLSLASTLTVVTAPPSATVAASPFATGVSLVPRMLTVTEERVPSALATEKVSV